MVREAKAEDIKTEAKFDMISGQPYFAKATKGIAYVTLQPCRLPVSRG